MRCTQYVGLPEEAKVLISGLKDRPDGEKIYGMFDEITHTCRHYYDSQGNLKYKEVLQAVPWSSGPVIFIKLIDPNGNDVCMHSQEDIDDA